MYNNPYNGGNAQSQNQSNQYNDKLEPIFNFGVPANHLLTFGLVHRIVGSDMAEKDYKDKYFFFVTLAPGIGQGSNRSYDFQNGKITQKFSTREISGLAMILKQCALGNISVLPYSKFSQSQGMTKNLAIWMGQKQNQSQSQQMERQICITINAQQKHTIFFTPAEAYSLGEKLEFLFRKTMELEFEESLKSPKPQFNQQNSNQFQNNPSPQFVPSAPQQQGFSPNINPQPSQGFNAPQGNVNNNQFQPQPQQGDNFANSNLNPNQPNFSNPNEQKTQTANQFTSMLNNM